MAATALDDVMHPENYLNLLTNTLAELADRLRHSADQVPAETAVPTSTPRLEAAAQMLTGASLRHELGPMASLGDGLTDFLTVLRDCPGCDLGWLTAALDLLAETLEAALSSLDAGTPVAQVAADPEWLLVISRLENAGTPLEIMDELDACAKGWEGRWCDQDLSAELDQQLQRRWQTFRRYGDAMFGRTDDREGDPVPNRRPAPQVVLLVESVLRREHLLQKLRDRGLGVKVASTAAEAAVLAAAEPGLRAVLCDDLEPSRNLARLATLWADHHQRPSLVLITGGSGNENADLQRARNHGAAGVWVEPFNTDPLADL